MLLSWRVTIDQGEFHVIFLVSTLFIELGCGFVFLLSAAQFWHQNNPVKTAENSCHVVVGVPLVSGSWWWVGLLFVFLGHRLGWLKSMNLWCLLKGKMTAAKVGARPCTERAASQVIFLNTTLTATAETSKSAPQTTYNLYNLSSPFRPFWWLHSCEQPFPLPPIGECLMCPKTRYLKLLFLIPNLHLEGYI